tara:strand:- start:503 stop:907 length:405 start_codon:yes stop_codon:yes gene_type:complete
MSKFGRDDIKDFIRNFQDAALEKAPEEVRLLNECGCEDSEYGLDDEFPGLPEHSYADLPGLFAPMQDNLADASPCPDSYNKTANIVLQDPNIVINLLKPALANLGIGCPASMAKAVGDILSLSQETGITPVFKN